MTRKPETRDIEAFIPALPDAAGARTFLARLRGLSPPPSIDFDRDQQLLARLLTIAAYSPYLGETILRHPEHIAWLDREAARGLDRVKSKEQLSEEMARFVTGAIERDLRAKLARFKRRELLRIYLRDCLGRATLAEVTDELSTLADVILAHALSVAHQEMVNRHGPPLIRDERGRIEQAEFAVVSLGKLGCRELNYASDIDLLFLYAGDGVTASDGRNAESAVSNKAFFAGVAEQIVQLIGSNSGEGLVYRIDLRLRPYGRDGDMVWEVERAADYYREKAQNWERQALIRARASAGSDRVVSRFVELVRDVVFAPDALPGVVADVRRAKEKIDRSVARRGGGFNVKLGRGGIREIEFIAQALQLARGGREPWVRSAQTLIVLGRLAEKHYLSETECSRLSAAYEFLRKAEHRLQMEHGAQTHRLPATSDRLELLARRCGYRQSADPAALFLSDLEAHTASVRAIYDRVFATAANAEAATAREAVDEATATVNEKDEEAGRLIHRASIALEKLVEAQGNRARRESTSRGAIDEAIKSALPSTINPTRALRNLTAWAESLATYHGEKVPALPAGESDWPTLIERLLLVLSSQYLSHVLVSRPALARVLIEPDDTSSPSDFHRAIRAVTDRENGAAEQADALRRIWYRLVMKMGYRDMAEVSGQWSVASGQSNATNRGGLSSTARDFALRASNVEQTALAEAVLSIAVEIALESMDLTPSRHSSATDHRPLTTDHRPPSTDR
ncbi:MAG TPA: hypothetical protein VK747_21580, partial [Blastocatellia bacterium]|nr:hypothetical protein [Blastocatellia bacterium]